MLQILFLFLTRIGGCIYQYTWLEFVKPEVIKHFFPVSFSIEVNYMYMYIVQVVCFLFQVLRAIEETHFFKNKILFSQGRLLLVVTIPDLSEELLSTFYYV